LIKYDNGKKIIEKKSNELRQTFGEVWHVAIVYENDNWKRK
jgi:hypothetical protein